MSGHTPGPWFVGGDGGTGDPRMVFCDDLLGSSVVDCRKHGAGVTSDQSFANANLIAAAPGLLEALRRCLPLVRALTVRQVMHAGDDGINACGLSPWCLNEGTAQGHERIDASFIDAAIAKAEGR